MDDVYKEKNVALLFAADQYLLWTWKNTFHCALCLWTSWSFPYFAGTGSFRLSKLSVPRLLIRLKPLLLAL